MATVPSRSLRAFGVLFAILTVAACTPKYAAGPGSVPLQRPGPPPVATPRPTPTSQPPAIMAVSALPHWASEDHSTAFAAFQATCNVGRDAAMAAVCRKARAAGPLGPSDARAFFETNFRAAASPPAGVLTAYFAPVYEARERPDAEFSAPVRPRPDDLKQVDGGVFRDNGFGMLEPYPDRAEIERRPETRPLAWMRPEELFFLQIQGSGVLTFADGRQVKAAYAANNGRPFVGIANPMRDRGLLAANNTSGEAIRGWLAAHRGPQADEIMRINPRFAFFRLLPDDGREPVGAAGVPLPSGRAIAVDPAFHTYGELHWIDAEAPILAGAFPTYRRLAMALDTGGAIKGDVRADLYIGSGALAGAEAGRVRHTLKMYRLIPNEPSP